MSLIKWNQPSSLTNRRNWIENFFAETRDFFKTNDWDMNSAVPAVNVKEESNAFQIEVSAPGLKKEDIKLSLNNGVLTISAKNESSKEEMDDRFVRREFSYSNFSRSFWLPENVKPDSIEAKYDQGVLKLTLPKENSVPATKSKEIKIS